MAKASKNSVVGRKQTMCRPRRRNGLFRFASRRRRLPSSPVIAPPFQRQTCCRRHDTWNSLSREIRAKRRTQTQDGETRRTFGFRLSPPSVDARRAERREQRRIVIITLVEESIARRKRFVSARKQTHLFTSIESPPCFPNPTQERINGARHIHVLLLADFDLTYIHLPDILSPHHQTL